MVAAIVTVMETEAESYMDISGPTKFFMDESDAHKFVREAEFEDMRNGRKLYYYVERA